MLGIIKVLLRDKLGVFMFGWLKRKINELKESMEHSMRGGEHYATLQDPTTGSTSNRRNSVKPTNVDSGVDRQKEEFLADAAAGFGSRGDARNGKIPVAILVDEKGRPLETLRAQDTRSDEVNIINVINENGTFYIPKVTTKEQRKEFLTKIAKILGAKIEIESGIDGKEYLRIKEQGDFKIYLDRHPETKEIGFKIKGFTAADIAPSLLETDRGSNGRSYDYIGANALLRSLRGFVNEYKIQRNDEFAAVTKSKEIIADKNIKTFFEFVEEAQSVGIEGKSKMPPIEIIGDEHGSQMRIQPFSYNEDKFSKLRKAFSSKGYGLAYDHGEKSLVVTSYKEGDSPDNPLAAFSNIMDLVPTNVLIEDSAGFIIGRAAKPELART